MYTLYILRCKNNSLYTGITNDLNARLEKHSNGQGSKYVKAFSPFVLVYIEKLQNKSEALKREIAIKKLSKSEKEELVINAKQYD